MKIEWIFHFLNVIIDFIGCNTSEAYYNILQAAGFLHKFGCNELVEEILKKINAKNVSSSLRWAKITNYPHLVKDVVKKEALDDNDMEKAYLAMLLREELDSFFAAIKLIKLTKQQKKIIKLIKNRIYKADKLLKERPDIFSVAYKQLIPLVSNYKNPPKSWWIINGEKWDKYFNTPVVI